ncbi:MAG: hypothetical protein IRZ16_11435 [Myxococcaceae bacterium]|nr:hypothetical protein [Myxococcaceae bacterium]
MTTDLSKRVPAVVLRMILSGIEEVTGSQYARVLSQAGLMRYADEPPPEDQSPTITEPELSALYGATYDVIGESLTRLFLTRYGQKLPEAMLAGPAGQEMLARMAGVPEAERLGTAIRLIAETGTKLWTPMRATEDDQAYYLEIENCAICARIHNARSPICANSEFFYGALARALTGFRLTALEIECAAVGAPKCKYRIRK